MMANNEIGTIQPSIGVPAIPVEEIGQVQRPQGAWGSRAYGSEPDRWRQLARAGTENVAGTMEEAKYLCDVLEEVIPGPILPPCYELPATPTVWTPAMSC